MKSIGVNSARKGNPLAPLRLYVKRFFAQALSGEVG